MLCYACVILKVVHTYETKQGLTLCYAMLALSSMDTLWGALGVTPAVPQETVEFPWDTGVPTGYPIVTHALHLEVL